MIYAINLALRHAMEQYDTAVILGQDIAKAGGVFRATDNLLTSFGPDRVIDMPLSEALIAGASVGMAVSGLRPIAEYQFMGFSYTGLDQIINHASRFSSRTMGKKNCPVVFRMPFGNHIRAPEHHTDSMEPLFAHVPGLTVLSPSNAQSAYDLTLQAISYNNPVVILEPLSQYHVKTSLDTSVRTYHLGKAHIKKTGSDITIVTFGGMLAKTETALAHPDLSEVDYELIDLSTLSPIDYPTILQSVKKTGRLVIIQESCLNCSIAQAISSTLMKEAFTYLRGPCEIVSSPDCIAPYFRNTDSFLPSSLAIKNACSMVMTY